MPQQQEPPGVGGDADSDPVVIGPQPGPMGGLGPLSGPMDILGAQPMAMRGGEREQGAASAFRPAPMPPPSPPQVIKGMFNLSSGSLNLRVAFRNEEKPQNGGNTFIVDGHQKLILTTRSCHLVLQQPSSSRICNLYIHLITLLLQMINIDDSPPRSLGLPGVSIASDFMPLVNSTRSRMLELNVEYRDSMIHLKVALTLIHQCTEDNEDSSSLFSETSKTCFVRSFYIYFLYIYFLYIFFRFLTTRASRL